MLMIVKPRLNNEDITANCLIQLPHVTLYEITQSKQLHPKDKIIQLGYANIKHNNYFLCA